MPISTRFVVNSTIILLSVGFLVLFGIIGMTVWLGERARIYSDEAGRLRDTRVAAVEFRSALQSAESSQRGFLVSGNEIYLAPYDTAKNQMNAQFGRVQQFLVGSNLDPVLGRLSGIIKEKIDEMDRTIALKADSRDNEALAMFRSNRGKALTDEANVFLSSIIRGQDERLTVGIAEQQRNATWLRLVSSVGGLVIVLVVGGVMVTLFRYTREISQTRDEVQQLNSTLENRVNDRTAALVQARDRAEENKTGQEIAYSIPKEGTIIWFDSYLVPKDAPHPKNALAFINYMLRPEVIAAVSNKVNYANGNKEATQFVNKEVQEDPGVYPPQEVKAKLVPDLADTEEGTRIMTRGWQQFTTGH